MLCKSDDPVADERCIWLSGPPFELKADVWSGGRTDSKFSNTLFFFDILDGWTMMPKIIFSSKLDWFFLNMAISGHFSVYFSLKCVKTRGIFAKLCLLHQPSFS